MEEGGMGDERDILCTSKKRINSFRLPLHSRHVSLGSMSDEFTILLQLRASQYSSMAGAGSGSGPANFSGVG